MLLWFSRSGEAKGLPWRVRFDDGSEGLCAQVKAVGLATTMRIPTGEQTEGGWAILLPDPPGSVLLGFVPTKGPLTDAAKEATAPPSPARGKARRQGRRPGR